MGAARLSCFDCKHSFGKDSPYCGNPRLAELLDQANMYMSPSTPCEGVRDFKNACGYKANWFVKKQVPADKTL